MITQGREGRAGGGRPLLSFRGSVRNTQGHGPYYPPVGKLRKAPVLQSVGPFVVEGRSKGNKTEKEWLRREKTMSLEGKPSPCKKRSGQPRDVKRVQRGEGWGTASNRGLQGKKKC